jgi:hypothetical protein
MGGNLVEEQDRRFAAALGYEDGMGEHQAEQQRLLLAGRGARGGHALAAMGDGQILPVRAFGRTSRRNVARAIVAQHCAKLRLVPTFEHDGCAGEFVFRSRRLAFSQLASGFASASSLFRARIAAS